MNNVRNTSLVASLAVIGLVAGYFATKSATTEAPVVATTVVAPMPSATRPAEPQRPAAKMKAPAVAAERDAAPKAVALRRKPRPADAAQAAAAQGLAPSAFADGRPSHPEHEAAAYRPENAAVTPAKIARKEKNFSNPMDARWVKSLSGGGAKVGMGKSSTKPGNCSETMNCERKPAPAQAWVAGVVVTTERLEATPTQPLDGQLAKGHYLDDTPGVYVQ